MNASMTPKTIQIFLPGGDPRGIRVAEITTRIVQVIEVPRSLLQDFLLMPESEQVALYFLIGASEADAQQRVYIGQTGDLRARIVKHNKEKEFWERALVVISRTNSLTQTHAVFLEWYCIQKARAAARYPDENGNSGTRPHTPAPLEADCLEIFDTAKTLLSTLSYPMFDAVAQPLAAETDNEIFYCRGSGADGRGIYTQEGFVVLKGSYGRKDIVASIRGTADERARNKLLENKAAEIQGDKLVFIRDELFGSPSRAAMAVMGRSANGWLDWKNKDNETLDAVKRQAILE